MKFSELSVGTEFWTNRYDKPHAVKKINEEEVWDKQDEMSFTVKPDLEVTEVDLIYPAESKFPVDTPEGYPPEGIFDENLVDSIKELDFDEDALDDMIDNSEEDE